MNKLKALNNNKANIQYNGDRHRGDPEDREQARQQLEKQRRTKVRPGLTIETEQGDKENRADSKTRQTGEHSECTEDRNSASAQNKALGRATTTQQNLYIIIP